MDNRNNNGEFEITNLIYRYNEMIDAGDFEGAASVFKNAQLKLVTKEELANHQDFLSMLREVIVIYPDGTPKTKHLVTNVIIDIDEINTKASARSQYTVLQSTERLPLQIIAAGRYHDKFELVHGHWRFCYRDFTLFDFKGDVADHIAMEKLR